MKAPVFPYCKRMWVIRDVDIPTDWCASVSGVLMPNSRVGTCTAATKLNVEREAHSLLWVDFTWGNLRHAKISRKTGMSSALGLFSTRRNFPRGMIFSCLLTPTLSQSIFEQKETRSVRKIHLSGKWPQSRYQFHPKPSPRDTT